MPRRRKYEQIRCPHFEWTLVERKGVWYADGRSNTINAGRHSLGTKSRTEALERLPQLDLTRAEALGLIPMRRREDQLAKPLYLIDGREAFEKYLARPRVAGGVKKSTRKRYRTVFDKFIEFAESKGIKTWNRVTEAFINEYASDLEAKNYTSKTIRNELITLTGCFRWLIGAAHLSGMEPIKLKLRKVESQKAYCYKAEEVRAIIEHCDKFTSLHWLRDVIFMLACTGMRIAELATIRWSDIDLENGRLTLVDESGQAAGERDDRRETKNSRSRSLPLSPELLLVLKAKEQRGREVFVGPRRGRFKPDTARRIFVRDVIEPLSVKFPTQDGERGFKDGRFHSFRHYFCSKCANSGVPERIVMQWLGHADSEMIKHYYHLHNDESKRQMNHLDFLGRNDGRSVQEAGGNYEQEDAGPDGPKAST